MERYQRAKGKKSLLGSHQKCWIWGRNLVLETLRAGRWSIAELHVAEDLPAESLEEIRAAAECRRVPLVVEPSAALTDRSHTAEHQGFLAAMRPFPYVPPTEFLASVQSAPAPLCVMLDQIQDPYNLGAIIRSAEVFGLSAVILGTRAQVGVTSMVARSSAGAVSRVPVVRADGLEEMAAALAAEGVPLVGASEKAVRTLAEYDFRGAACVVVGNEGRGISSELAARCQTLLRIPQHGRIGSLNAAAAAAVFFYEAQRQRQTRGR